MRARIPTSGFDEKMVARVSDMSMPRAYEVRTSMSQLIASGPCSRYYSGAGRQLERQRYLAELHGSELVQESERLRRAAYRVKDRGSKVPTQGQADVAEQTRSII